jgi:TonB family protein
VGATLAAPTAVDQFDFHRPATADAAGGVIILHGIIRQNGTVGELSLVQGTNSTSNAAAMAAFSRWKFKPPLRGSSPVSLEILVGIR